MSENGEDPSRSMMLDGNAAAGLLQEVFSAEMTAAPTECASCGKQGEVGTLIAFVQAPGLVLRCPACESVMVRMVRSDRHIYLDARGAVYLRISA
jgi:Zn finger protein HypA/HybF involved in hydrogenase expression